MAERKGWDGRRLICRLSQLVEDVLGSNVGIVRR